MNLLPRRTIGWTSWLGALLLAAGCSSPLPQDDEASSDPTQTVAASPYDSLPPEVRGLLDRPFTDDLDAMVQRRVIRAGVVFNRTHYFIDRGVQRGLTYE